MRHISFFQRFRKSLVGLKQSLFLLLVAAVLQAAHAQVQTIVLVAAWNLKSLNIHPLDSSVKAVFGAGAGFLCVKDNFGNQYCPMLSQDQIGTVHTSQAYQIYSSVAETLKIAGTPVDYANTPISLSAGWNLIGYLPQVGDSVWHATASISSSVIIVKDNSGQACWEYFCGPYFGIMSPGEGYKLLLNAPVLFTYPTPATQSASGR